MDLRHFVFLLTVVVAPLATRGAAAADLPDLPQPVSRTTKMIHGWTVRIDDRLLAGPDAGLGARALEMLAARLSDIEFVVARDRVEKLKTVPVVLDLTHGRLRTMQYHPSAEWLRGHGYAPELAKCVHIPRAADFVRARQVNEQPWVVLHELAHAYHDQVLGFDDARIREAYTAYQKSGHGENVLLFDGSRTRHYALTNAKEFFAEFTEAYFGLNDFFPFNRAELKTAEPAIYELLLAIWGPVQTGGSTGLAHQACGTALRRSDARSPTSGFSTLPARGEIPAAA